MSRCKSVKIETKGFYISRILRNMQEEIARHA